MKKISIVIITLAIGLLSCKKEKKETETTEIATETRKKIKMTLVAKNDSNVSGKVVFKEEDEQVIMTAIISGLEAGQHAIHIHESSDCSAPDGTSTGGHWNPTAQPHGKWGANAGYHKGDIGNFTADENGNGTISFTTDEWCIGCNDENKNIVGKAIIVHAGADDFTSQPSGAAGARISCAGIIE
ncbi:superoxide dismutase family protein [Tamlana crocina]